MTVALYLGGLVVLALAFILGYAMGFSAGVPQGKVEIMEQCGTDTEKDK